MTDEACGCCGKRGCPSAADPPGGPMTRHNAAAYAALQATRAEASERDHSPVRDLMGALKPSLGLPTGREHVDALRERVVTVIDELTALQREVADLPLFLGQFHAENGLRQARTYASDCLHRLPARASEQV